MGNHPNPIDTNDNFAQAAMLQHEMNSFNL